MTDIVKRLHDDHHNMARLVKLLQTELHKLGSDDQVNYEIMTDIMRYMVEYSDVIHHPVEDVIFEKIKLHDDPITNSVPDLSKDHDKIADSGRAFLDILEIVNNGGFVEREKIRALGDAYTTDLISHMRFEETEFLPNVRNILNTSELVEIEYALSSKDDPLFGDTVEEEYNELYRQIMNQAEDA